MMITTILNAFKLNLKEQAVFQKILELGTQPASQIARLLEVPRNTARGILDKLVKKGLLAKSQKGNTQYYTAESPKNIVRFLEIKKKKEDDTLQNQIELIKKYGEELQPGRFAGGRPKITFYDGIEGVKRVYEDTLTSSETIRAYASLDEMFEVMGDYFPDYFKRRSKKKVGVRLILPDCPKARERTAHNKEELRESRLIPRDKYNFSPEINIYDRKVIIISWKEKLGVMIESDEISEVMKTIFELAWLQANRYDEKLRKKK